MWQWTWKWTLIFLLLAIVAAVLGFGGIAGTFASIAQVLFFVFIAVLLISAITYAARAV